MTIKLRLDNNGKPYLEINTYTANYGEDIENNLTRYFIKEAIKNGLTIEDDHDVIYGYATIKIREKEK